ncbi:MAG: hypothetical protein HUJ99_04430, partial [Bacteroidaceae bacterium]|nr:hypothetical protein [Bacteroidaceae bacterium]
YQDDARHYVLKTAVTKIDNHFFHILLSRDFREATIYLDAPAQLDNDFLLKAHFICENILRFLYAQNTASRQTICVHASAVEHQGKAYLFMGHSGSGKSTHSQLWLKHFSGTTLINDDNPVIRLDEQGQPIVYGSPWSGKTPCYKNVAYPLGGMTRIMQANKNAIEAYRPIDGYRFLRASASGLPFIDRTVADGLYETVEQIIRQFPVYLLACKPDKDAAELCKNTLVK